MAKKKEFGKGLKALLENIDSIPQNTNVLQDKIKSEDVAQTFEIPIDRIDTNPFQPRAEFEAEALNELAESIKIHGLIQPITVRILENRNFQLISGERRVRAAKIAGLVKIPAYIRTADDQGMLEMALVENTQRSDLNSIEIAMTYQRLIHECNITHEELAERVSKNRSTITNYIRLLKLPPDVQQGIRNNKISMGHARVLAGIEDPASVLHLFQLVIEKNLSVRATEQLARSIQKGNFRQSSKKNTLDPEIQSIQDNLSHQLGTKIEIKRNAKGKGRIIIPFDSDKSLNRLLDILGSD